MADRRISQIRLSRMQLNRQLDDYSRSQRQPGDLQRRGSRFDDEAAGQNRLPPRVRIQQRAETSGQQASP